MSNDYLFQKKKITFTKKLFRNGLSAAHLILLSLKEAGDLLLRELPNSYPGFKILKDSFGINKKREFNKREIYINFGRLEKQGLIKKEKNKKFYILTDEGENMVAYIQDRYSVFKKPWDGNLRIVIFDIPEKKRYHREWVRDELLLLNFKELQKSVYIGKYPLPLGFYKDIVRFDLNDFVFVFTVNNIDKKEKVTKLLED